MHVSEISIVLILCSLIRLANELNDTDECSGDDNDCTDDDVVDEGDEVGVGVGDSDIDDDGEVENNELIEEDMIILDFE